MTAATHLRELGSEVAAFLLATGCAGCGRQGTLLCEGCRDALAPEPRDVWTPEGIRVRAALAFDGTAARCIRRLKGDGETLLARPLGAALAGVLAPCLLDDVSAVPVPTSRAAFRRRGYRVPELLIRRAGAVPWRAARWSGAREDQRALGVRERIENVRGAMRVRREGGGARVVLVDDVITTGATIDEGVRALRDGGFEVVAAVALAATPRLRGGGTDSSATHRK